MNKARKSFDPMPRIHVQDNDYLMHPRVRLVPFPRERMQVRGNFEALVQPLVRALGHEKTVDAEKYLLVPAHEMQIPNMEQRFHVRPLEGHLTMEALTSIRSVAKPDVLPGLSLKLCLGIKVSSALRTITPYTTYFGPDFSNRIVPQLKYDRSILKIERELASAVVRSDDPDVAKHGSCVVREAVEFGNEETDEHYVVCAALVEKIKADSDERLVTKVWQLDSDEKRAKFLDKYMDVLLRAVLPPCIENGVAFEAHGQNMLARFNAEGDLTGFAVRDFGGIKIYPPSLKESCGLELDVLPDSCVVAHRLNEVSIPDCKVRLDSWRVTGVSTIVPHVDSFTLATDHSGIGTSLRRTWLGYAKEALGQAHPERSPHVARLHGERLHFGEVSCANETGGVIPRRKSANHRSHLFID